MRKGMVSMLRPYLHNDPRAIAEAEPTPKTGHFDSRGTLVDVK